MGNAAVRGGCLEQGDPLRRVEKVAVAGPPPRGLGPRVRRVLGGGVKGTVGAGDPIQVALYKSAHLFL